MYENHRPSHKLLQLALDCIFLKLSWECAIHIRIFLNPIFNAHVSAQQAAFWTPPFALVLALWLASSFGLRLYRLPDEPAVWPLLVWTLENAFLVTTLTAVTTFFSREFGELVSRMFVPVLFPIVFVLLGLGRYVGFAVLAMTKKLWAQPHRVALVGDWGRAGHALKTIQATQGTAIRGLILPQGALWRDRTGTLPVLGTTDQVAELINTEQLDTVIVLNASLSSAELEHCSQVCKRMGVAVRCAIDPTPEPVRFDLSTHYGLPFVEMTPVEFTRGQEVVKRIFDLVFSALALGLLTPLLLALAAVIKLTSEGPILYKSPRVGKGGRHFTFLKFRSMYVSNHRSHVARANEKGGHIFKMRNDPRVTPVGRFLRQYSLDELPQLINVLRGEMSIVGPRPLPAGDLGPDGMSEQFSAWSEARAQVWPGLTGLWQISGRSDLSFDDMVRLDLAYIQQWSLALDVRIIFHTPMLVLRGVGAY